MKLRPYQQRAIDQLYAWFRKHKGHPVIVMPTGSGKSHVIAALCVDALQNWPETRILMLTHRRELITQNKDKLLAHWPDAPVGVFSAGIGEKTLHKPITFAGIQSIRKKAKDVGFIDLVIIDENHLVSHKDEGGYREFIQDLTEINPNLRVIGLTATPWRLGHGYITDPPALFSDPLIQPVGIEELVSKGYLSDLRSKATDIKLDVSDVKKRGGEYIDKDLQEAVDTKEYNKGVVEQVISLGHGRKAWLFFCSGVAHAENVCFELVDRGIVAECVTGATPKKERDRILEEFKAGKIQAVTNANVLTTGFDHPGIDLIAMLRPTMSVSLYCQMAGRGMRTAPDKENCLVLDFAGVVRAHGPIVNPTPPDKAREGSGESPVKVCPGCNELVAPAVRQCPACGFLFPEPKKKKLMLHDDDIMGRGNSVMEVTRWTWYKHTSRSSGKDMLAVTYYGGLSDTPITEYLPVTHGGYAEQRAMGLLVYMAQKSLALKLPSPNSDMIQDEWLEAIASGMNKAICPESVEYKKDGKFYRITARTWPEIEEAPF